jgi:Zn finger protein HypA/HybF involved in hydrogenase expression
MNEEEFLAIKPEKTPEEKTKWIIESDIFYICKCKHCMIVFLVEEEADSFKTPKHPKEIVLTCPVCHTLNLIPKGENRLKLRLDRIMKPDETNPWYNGIIERERRVNE